ncbi:insulinase family protein [Vibrio metschnikovii]|nr:insulinase family protein [Vibrio metschnikovii]
MNTRIMAGLVSLSLLGCVSHHPTTPLQADQRWVTGQLDNGLTYHLYPDHHQPVSIRFYVHAGSLQESPEQSGYAHFVEHMAFNGSIHYQHNDVIKMVQQTGASFGADLNAFTSYKETVYSLDLPDNLAIDKALLWFRDIADGLHFTPQEVEKEKGVIMGEFRYRISDDKPFEQKFYEQLIAKTIYAQHDVLGTRDSVQQATPERLKTFYQTWYQPQLTEIVITGNVTLEQGEKWIQEYFADWQAGETRRPVLPSQTKLDTQDFIDYVATGEHPSFSLLIDRGEHRITNHEQLINHRLDNIAEQLISYRLAAEFNQAAQVHTQLHTISYRILDQRYSLISVAFPYQQRGMVTDLTLSTLSSLRDFGVSEQELQAVLHSYQDDLLYATQNKHNRLPPEHANDRVWAISNQEVLQSDLDFQYGLKQLLSKASVEEVNRHLKQLLRSDATIIIGADRQETLSKLTNQRDHIQKTKQRRGIKTEIADINPALYQPIQQGEIISSQSIHTDPDIVHWQLENGVDAYLLRTYSGKKKLQLFYSSLGGYAALPNDLFYATDISPTVLMQSGLGDMNGAQTDSYLKRKNMSMATFIDTTSHWLRLEMNQKDLDEGFAMIHQFSTRPNLDLIKLDTTNQQHRANLSQFVATPLGQLIKAVSHDSYNPSSAHWFRDTQDQPIPTADQVMQVHQQLFQQGNFTLVIVGDVTPSTITPLLRQYIANIPLAPSQPLRLTADYSTSISSQLELPINTDNHTLIVHRYIAADSSVKSAKTVFLEDMLYRLATQRLLANIRENKGLDYTPEVIPLNKDSEPSSDWSFITTIDSAYVEQTQQAVQEVIESLTQYISQEEVQTVAKQLIVDLKPLQDRPEQMASMLSRYLIHGYGIEALMNIEDTANSIRAEEMQHRAKQMFGDTSIKQISIMTPKQSG